MVPSMVLNAREVRSGGIGALKSGVSLLAIGMCGLITAPAVAQAMTPVQAVTQDAQAQTPSEQAADAQAATEGEDIVVTGYREALESAQAIKRNSDVIVDSVTAEDIGALPDRSVTETLQRIPGVTINRFAAGVDPDHFSVEGAGVVIRGLTYTGSRFNGRDAFSAGNGAGLSFRDIPTELLAGVDVFKTPSSDMIEGGIGGIVNLRTRLPLNEEETLIAGSLEMNYSDFINRGAPTASVLVSKKWDTDAGKFGLLGSFSYSQLFAQADRIAVSAFRPRTTFSDGTRTDVFPFDGATAGESILFPRGATLGRQQFNRERYSYSAAAQYESPDERLAATFQFLRADAREAWGEKVVEIAVDNVAGNGDSRAVAGTSINFDDSGLFESGFITAPTGWRADQVTNDVRTPVRGLQSNNIRRDHAERIETSDYSANLRWRPTDRLTLTLDYQHVDSRSRVEDNTLWISSYQDAFIQLNGRDFPTVRFQPPQNCINPTCPAPEGSNGGTPGFDDDDHPSYFGAGRMSFLDPFNSFYRASMDHLEDSDGNEDALRIDGELAFPETGFLKSVKAGARYADTKQTARFSIYNWGVLSEQWGNDGPVWLTDNVDGVQGGSGGAPLTNYRPEYYDNFFRGDATNPVAGSGRFFYGGDTIKDRAGYIAYAGQIAREWQGTTTCAADGRTINAGWNSIADRCGNLEGTPFQPGEVNPQREKNWAGYVMARFDNDFANGWNLSGNVGVRYTHTDRRSQGFLQFANNPGSIPSDQTCATVPAGTTPPPFCTFDQAVRQQARNFLDGAVIANDVDQTYDFWLPSANVRLQVADGVQFRASYFKGVFDAPFGFTRNFRNVQGLSTVAVTDPTTGLGTGQFSITSILDAGNPNLLPTKSDNYDLTAEWYFSRVGQLTAAFFYKELRDVVTNETTVQSLTNNGSTFDAIVTTAVNSPETGKIRGVEVSYQQTYDFLPGVLSGLGLQATYTYVESDGVPQTTLNATEPTVQAGLGSTISGENFPLQGLSKHTVNVTPFIDIGKLSLRASYNWRSRYLLTLRDVIVPFDPIFQRAYGQLDASATVDITPQFKIGVQAVNLLNSITKTEAAVLDAAGEIRYVPRQWYGTDRRYTLITRFSF